MKQLSPQETKRLFYRRQFVLGPRILKSLSSWRLKQIGSDLFVQAHPDLAVTQVKDRDFCLTLLGYILDPDNPDDTDIDILTKLISRIKTVRDILKETYSLGGRWILIASDGKDTILFNDPCGLRQVVYTTPDYGELWCASQPSILAKQRCLSIDKNVEELFSNSAYFHNDGEYYCPGDATPYKEIKQLLPNHYLNQTNGEVHRFWPRDPLGSITLKHGVAQSANLLKALMQSANNRFQLALPITAGIDSRVIFAACKDIKEKVFYYTLKYRSLTDKSADIYIPRKLLAKYKLTHHLIDCKLEAEEDFRRIYHLNISFAHDTWEVIARGLYRSYPQDKICLKGNCSEIIRGFYCTYQKYTKKITASFVANLVGMKNNIFAISELSKWLDDAKTVEDYGYDLLDILYWEQRIGRWQATSQLEWDIIQEVFTTFNCRELLVIGLSVDKKYRRRNNLISSNDNYFHRCICDELWPAVLDEPVNPLPIKGQIKRLAKVLTGRVGLFSFMQSIKHLLKNRFKET